jgi:UPF0755 protein
MEFLKRNKPWVVAFVLALILVTGYEITIAPPRSFVAGTLASISRGSTLADVADDLAREHVIQHPLLLRALLKVTGQGDSIKTGLYKFDAPTNLITVAYRLVSGDYGISPARLTFIEGVTNADIATQVAEALPGLTQSGFLMSAEGQQGFLFPDTYFFQPGVEATIIVSTMRANFDTKISDLQNAVAGSGHTLTDIVKMAAIVEKEARTTEDKHIVAGILWSRIKLDMALQVDAAKETYLHTGFPPEPICNPGLDSIEAAVAPIKTAYLYYLTGKDGLMHYATTYAQHQANLRKYLQ